MMGMLVCIALIIMLTILERRSEEVTFSAIIIYSIFWAVARFLQQRWVWVLKDADSFSMYEQDKNSTERGEEILRVRYSELSSLSVERRRYALLVLQAEKLDGTKINIVFRARDESMKHIEEIAEDFEKKSQRTSGKDEVR